jgi:tryptophanyl-tRNA synthetase
MTQFKDKSGYDQENVSVGLFDYPVLMASDILLYDTKIVPVGEDQVQHVELTRDLARRFNHQFGQTLIEPEARLMKQGARIMGLDDPMKKMSKSAASEYNYVALTDDPEKAAKKIMRAETDSGSEVKFDEAGKPGISNLLTIYSLFSGKDIKVVEKEFAGKGYGDFKKAVVETVKTFLLKFQSEYDKISDDDVRAILDDGAKRARPIAEKKLDAVKEKVGLK